MKKLTTLTYLLTLLLYIGCNQQKEIQTVEKWDVYQIELTGPAGGNPFLDVELNAVFVHGDKRVKVPGFYDGEGKYYIRFSPDVIGEWIYSTESNSPQLSKKTGKFNCISPTGSNHGPVKNVNTFYLQYADETPYYAVGTTAYQWTSVKQSIQEKTLRTLSTSPFNKIRMCVFPKSYKYGNDSEPWMYPFKREGEKSDLTQPNYPFFQNFDIRIGQLMEKGIQADVILFHPYDSWGYCEMGDGMNEKYVRYMIARLSAYRNVWWSLANEWDVPKIKETIDWEGIGTLLQKEDPHQRLRGIHNWYNSEDHFYDHSRSWITHVSAQTSQFYNAIKWRNRYQKPLLFDEMRYEGDVESSWGNMSSEEMSSYFWMAGLSGGYGTHGDTYQNNSDDETEVRWWAKGGTLVGKSTQRIKFFRTIMEEAPVYQMTPELYDNKDPQNINSNIYVLSKAGEYYMAYVADSEILIELNLEGENDYIFEVLDTWNMKIVSREVVESGSFQFLTQIPYTAIRLYPN
ncbi:DUF5060 domain-containing protein [Draconibacterium sp.]|nr:DUF5060 domain-containing protein [Draconibacterium sp.]